LQPGSPHLWIIDVTDPAVDALADRGLCSDAERARAEAFRTAEGGRSLLARRAALRIVLARYLGSVPGDVRLVVAPGGKPVALPTANQTNPTALAFSVGHSGALYCIAVGAERSVGCDVERVRTVPRAEAIAARWFGPGEARVLAGLPAADVELAFMELWTAKEALAKRHGAGLRLMQGQREEEDVRSELDVAAERAAGRLRAFEPADGYLGALASTGQIAGVEVVRATSETWCE
jgi:4'-phosphopantetheinyl transferase